MNKFQISINSIGLENNCSDYSYGLWGKIHVMINGECFPNFTWCDSISSILDMWTTSMITFTKNPDENCLLFFMDGPYYLQLSMLPNNCVLVSAKDTDNAEYVSAIYSLNEVLSSIIDCSLSFIEFCKKNVPTFHSCQVCSKIINNTQTLARIQKQNTGNGLCEP